jgi:hypothetical protein
MTFLKRIINLSTHDLERLQQAIFAEIDRRKSLTGATIADEEPPHLAIAPEPEQEPLTSPPRRAA